MLKTWTSGASSRSEALLAATVPAAEDGRLPLDGRFHRALLDCPGDGSLVLDLHCPRPLRLWLDGQPVLDEPLPWRSFQRELHAAVIVPVRAGPLELLVEVGERPVHPSRIDRECPSRERAEVMAAVAARFPDLLTLAASTVDAELPPLSLRFSASQFHRDGVCWQQLQARRFPDWRQPPGTEAREAAETLPVWPLIEAIDWPGQVHEASTDADRAAGVRRLWVPVGASGALPPLRTTGVETRPEPRLEVATTTLLRVEGEAGAATVVLPVHESLGRLAPRREWREQRFPEDAEALLARLPEPILPPHWAHLHATWRAAWRMLVQIVRHPAPEGGLPNAYVATARQPMFPNEVFVWDSSFTALAYAYGWRDWPGTATLDMLYSRQMDGGYLHREHDTRDGMPLLYEPGFSPNPPLLAIAELQLAKLSGGLGRLRQVQPLLVEQFRWIEANRRLDDGTYWTTGLANGLDNSPSLGDGYPDLTAQMAHFADCLAEIAALLGDDAQAASWREQRDAIGAALNARLWSDELQFYSTSLPGGGHNPNKVVTGFWPLWAGTVPPERVEQLARHLKDPSSFWRHHPVPSLAADSPQYQPEGDYWRGSTWAPTTCATAKGFQRAGRLDLARELVHRHLAVLAEVLADTGELWENYCAERSARGSICGPGYSWTAVGPIALLLEVVLGLEPDAIHRRLRWTPPAGEAVGVQRYPLGPATLRLEQSADGAITVDTDRPFTLELVRGEDVREIACAAGRTRV